MNPSSPVKTLPAVILLMALTAPICLAQKATFDPKLRNLVRARAQDLISSRKTAGLVVGLLTKQGSMVIGFGTTGREDASKPDGRTLFEIGSITKVFTALLLADLAEKGKVKLETPLRTLLPDGQKLPRHTGGEITLLDLATHTSGLPRMPTMKDLRDPFAAQNAQVVHAFLASLADKPAGSPRYSYSNLGFGVLGHTLGTVARLPYEQLLKNNICKPLGLRDTGITLTRTQKNRLARGHQADVRRDDPLSPTGRWNFADLEGCGAIVSSVDDLLIFLQHQAAITKSPLRKIMDASQQQRRDRPGKRSSVALGWHLEGRPDDTDSIIWHNGGTNGYTSFAGFFKKPQVGLVILNNSNWSVTAMGFEILKRLAAKTD